jgi:hypothetical protein
MESEQAAVNLDATSAWFTGLSFMVDGIPRELVFNMDETRCSVQTNSRQVQVISRIDSPDPSVPIPNDSHSKHSTFLACITADGFRMKPFAIVPGFTAEKELRYHGYDEPNVILTSQSNAFMTRELFALWTKTVFFSIIDQRGRDLGYQGNAPPPMNGLGSHHTEQFLVEYAARNIKVLFLIAHASDQLHSLDFLTFAMMKQTFSASKFSRLAKPLVK